MDFDCTPGYSLSKDMAMHLYPVWPCLVADVEEMMPLHCCGGFLWGHCGDAEEGAS